MHILKAIKPYDEEAKKTYSQLRDETPGSEAFKRQLLERIRDIHMDVE